MAKLQTAVNKVKRLEEQTNPVNNMPEGLGTGSINTAMRDLPTQTVQQTAQQPSQADLYAIQEKRRLQALEQQKRNALATLNRKRHKSILLSIRGFPTLPGRVQDRPGI